MLSKRLKESLTRLMMMDIDQLNAERMEKNRRERLAAFFDPNLYLMLIFAFVLMMMMLNGCAEQSEDPKKVNDKPKTAELEAVIVSDPNPNKYSVELKWKFDGERPLGWFVRREESESGKEYLTALEVEKASFIDARVVAGKTYRYEFGSVENIGNVKRAEATVTIPTDLEVTGTVTNPKMDGIHRLFLRSGSRLQTLGQDFKLNVTEIVSDKGVIESFPEGLTGPAEANGRPGARIEIRAKKVSGTLYIYGRGENGGNGFPGRKGNAGKKGKEGHYALSTCEKVDVVCNCGHRAHELEAKAKSGDPLSLLQFMMEKTRHRCITQTGDGEAGAQGDQGGTGGNGGQGGESSKIVVEVLDPSTLDLKAYPMSGAGGAGGVPGDGGDGGPGGDAGSRSLDRYYVCHDSHPGPKGVQGPKGGQGRNGDPGKTNPMCLVLGNSRFGDCDGK